MQSIRKEEIQVEEVMHKRRKYSFSSTPPKNSYARRSQAQNGGVNQEQKKRPDDHEALAPLTRRIVSKLHKVGLLTSGYVRNSSCLPAQDRTVAIPHAVRR